MNPGQRLSLQRHEHRNEHWNTIQGQGKITKGRLLDDLLTLPMYSHEFVQRYYWHRVECISEVPLIFIEVQTGDSFEETDIERAQDDYGRSD